MVRDSLVGEMVVTRLGDFPERDTPPSVAVTPWGEVIR